MRLPLYLIVAQWTVLITLAVLVAIMFRQWARHLGLNTPTESIGPTVGTPAAAFEYIGQTESGTQLFEPGKGRATLLAFVDPTCNACEALVKTLGELEVNADLKMVRSLLLVSDPPSYLEISETFQKTLLPIGRILSDSTQEAYNATATPLLVAIDAAGIIRAAGAVIKPADVRAYVNSAVVPRHDRATLPIVQEQPDTNSFDMTTATIDGKR